MGTIPFSAWLFLKTYQILKLFEVKTHYLSSKIQNVYISLSKPFSPYLSHSRHLYSGTNVFYSLLFLLIKIGYKTYHRIPVIQCRATEYDVFITAPKILILSYIPPWVPRPHLKKYSDELEEVQRKATNITWELESKEPNRFSFERRPRCWDSLNAWRKVPTEEGWDLFCLNPSSGHRIMELKRVIRYQRWEDTRVNWMGGILIKWGVFYAIWRLFSEPRGQRLKIYCIKGSHEMGRCS